MLYFNVLYHSHFFESSDEFFKELSCFENTGNTILDTKLWSVIATKQVIAQFSAKYIFVLISDLFQAVYMH